MTGPWRPKGYRDTYTDRVITLINAKARNAEHQPAEGAPSRARKSVGPPNRRGRVDRRAAGSERLK